MTDSAYLERDAVDALPQGELGRKLALGRPLRVKLGIDPTAPDIHLGHTVVLRKLREFQDAGHRVVLIIGDFTARVGDPSGRSELRPVLEVEQIMANAATFQDQAYRVLDPDPERIEVRFNSEWLDMAMPELLRLLSTTTVGQLLERDDFAKRRAANQPVSMLEMLYPLLQGYDSVAVAADIELGGTDQKFNLLLARDIQRAYGVAQQAILTMPILAGTDGERKMSKSLGNAIGVTEPAEQLYGKTMSIPDPALASWWQLLLGRAAPEESPRDSKRALALALAERFHGPEAAQAAQDHFDRVVVARELPAEIEELVLAPVDGSVHLPQLIAEAFDMSRSDARRLIDQGGVQLDGDVVSTLDMHADALSGKVLRAGKRRFRKLSAPGS